mmetsp:Transcript_34751/g.90126  ORF Transcript_34751/g.90126 Transcript_34751/m.90126 type:complete len:83 (-) Transcript_34751:556-804(-)
MYALCHDSGCSSGGITRLIEDRSPKFFDLNIMFLSNNDAASINSIASKGRTRRAAGSPHLPSKGTTSGIPGLGRRNTFDVSM